uniref:Uncharacterized protein n=1 Tax=Oryza barthii TaxID=65489 RepID=A0A0D3EUR1_9ORYZ
MAPLPFSLPYRRRRSISPSPSRIVGTAPRRRVLDGGTAATTTVLSSLSPSASMVGLRCGPSFSLSLLCLRAGGEHLRMGRWVRGRGCQRGWEGGECDRARRAQPRHECDGQLWNRARIKRIR